MKLFLGEYEHNLDDRGRVTLARKIRQELEDMQVVLSKGFEQCIFGFDRESWENQARRQLESPVTELEGRKIRRYMFSGAEKVDIDKAGRVLLPTHLKEYAGIKSEIIIIGAGDHFEIWDLAGWQRYSHQLEAV